MDLEAKKAGQTESRMPKHWELDGLLAWLAWLASLAFATKVDLEATVPTVDPRLLGSLRLPRLGRSRSRTSHLSAEGCASDPVSQLALRLCR